MPSSEAVNGPAETRTCTVCGWAYLGDFIACKRCEHEFPIDEALYHKVAVVSYPKSGKTWLAYLYCYYTCAHFEVPDLDADFTYRPELRKKFQRLLLDRGRGTGYPIAIFHHGGSKGKKQTARLMDKTDHFLRQPTVLLIRDPRRVVVSYYHHSKTKGGEGIGTLSAFIRDEHMGLERIVAFLNLWARPARDGHPGLRIVRYEDLWADTERVLRETLGFMGVADVSPPALAHAVRESSFESMQRRERQTRLQSADGAPVATNQLRVRRGATGLSDELSQEDVTYLDRVLKERLDPIYEGYRTSSRCD